MAGLGITIQIRLISSRTLGNDGSCWALHGQEVKNPTVEKHQRSGDAAAGFSLFSSVLLASGGILHCNEAFGLADGGRRME